MSRPSGGGKTTLARLIARFADVTEGNILIGGVNVKNIDEKRAYGYSIFRISGQPPA